MQLKILCIRIYSWDEKGPDMHRSLKFDLAVLENPVAWRIRHVQACWPFIRSEQRGATNRISTVVQERNVGINYLACLTSTELGAPYTLRLVPQPKLHRPKRASVFKLGVTPVHIMDNLVDDLQQSQPNCCTISKLIFDYILISQGQAAHQSS